MKILVANAVGGEAGALRLDLGGRPHSREVSRFFGRSLRCEGRARTCNGCDLARVGWRARLLRRRRAAPGACHQIPRAVQLAAQRSADQRETLFNIMAVPHIRPCGKSLNRCANTMHSLSTGQKRDLPTELCTSLRAYHSVSAPAEVSDSARGRGPRSVIHTSADSAVRCRCCRRGCSSWRFARACARDGSALL